VSDKADEAFALDSSMRWSVHAPGYGDVFEFFRNTALDARTLSPERAEFSPGPAGRDARRTAEAAQELFLRYFDYEATWTTEGIETRLIPVLSAVECGENFADVADTLTGAVNGQYWANLLSWRLGTPSRPGNAVYRGGGAENVRYANRETAPMLPIVRRWNVGA
jgi:hypothetical protein